MDQEVINNDAVVVAPHLHKVIFENDKVRVLDVEVKPNDTAEMHAHPDNVITVIQGGTLSMTGKDGTTKEVTLETGATFFSAANEHAVSNNSSEMVKVIQVELK